MKAAYKWKIQNGIYGDITDEENYGGGVIGEYIASVINFLIGTGYLVKIEIDGNILIRTINKTEQKRKKLFVS